MGTGQIIDINVITNSRTIRSIVIISEYTQALTNTGCSLCNERDQVHRYPFGQFTNQRRRMRSNRVEITQCNTEELRISVNRIPQNIFADLFGISIRRCCRLARSLLSYRQYIRLSIYGTWGWEDNIAHPFVSHQLQNRNQRLEVIAIVEQRFFDRLTDSLWGGKMDNRIEFILIENTS